MQQLAKVQIMRNVVNFVKIIKINIWWHSKVSKKFQACHTINGEESKIKNICENNQDQHLVTFKSFWEMKSCKLVILTQSIGQLSRRSTFKKPLKKHFTNPIWFKRLKCYIFTSPWNIIQMHLSLIMLISFTKGKPFVLGLISSL